MEKVNHISVKFSKNNNIWRWRVGGFQSRSHFKSQLGAFLAARKFINGMSVRKKIKPKPVLTLVK